jgi:phosphoribosyl-ATP pyrophosphohydrolase
MAEKGVLERLEAAIAARRGAEAARSYVAALNAKGLDAILKKVGEEATEAVIASKRAGAVVPRCRCGSIAW